MIEPLPGEVWQVVAADTRYLVSNLGRVIGARGRLLKGRPNSRGYLQVCLGKRNEYVHLLVAVAFHGGRPRGMTVDHRDGDRLNNAAVNLRFLPARINSAGAQFTQGVEWYGRVNGVNLWSTPDGPPDGYVPMTDDEALQAAESAVAAGW